MIDLEEFKEFYLLHTEKETAEHFGISQNKVVSICKEHNIKKTRQQVNSLISRTRAAKHSINKDEFTRLYIEENHTQKFMMEYYGITSWMLDKIIREFDCHKDKKQSSKIGLETRYEQYGGKDNYFKHLHEINDDSKVKEYGSLDAYRQHLSSKCRSSWNSKTREEVASYTESRRNTCQSKYGVDFPCQLPQARFKGKDSTPNLAFENLLKENNIPYEREFPIRNRSYDFKIGNILIEINPTPTHNSTYGVQGEPKSKTYHKDKSKLATEFGFRCIHVWDWDNVNKIISILKPRERIFARNCQVKEVEANQAKEYLTKYHLQGYAKDEIRIGLFQNDELVSIMTFGKPRYSKKYEYELIRFCSHKFVVGGAEKLFQHFKSTFHPQSVVSYCDNSKFTGDTYLRIGFSKVNGGDPGIHWYNERTCQHITDNLLRQRGFDQLFGTHYGKGTDNKQLMLLAGFVEVYDCGQSTYTYFG